jgi:osmotically inducible protein OsmC
MTAIRRADCSWTGKLSDGRGTVSATTSQAFKDVPVNWGSRTEGPDGRSSPEELIAAAHASCFAMAFSGDLGRNGTPPERLEVSATVTFDKLEKWTITSSAIEVKGWVPGIEKEAFKRVAEGTRDNCPVSRALIGNVQLSVRAILEG